MNKIIFTLCFTLSTLSIHAQQFFPTYKVIDGDSIIALELNEVVVVKPMTFKNDTIRYKYNQLKYNVKTVIPYANEAVRLFNEIDSITQNMPRKQAKRYIKARERAIETEFEEPLKKLNITQGRILVKLINRKSKKTCFDIIKILHNPFRANYQQAIAKLNGIDLNEDYNPLAEKNLDLERILKVLGN